MSHPPPIFHAEPLGPTWIELIAGASARIATAGLRSPETTGTSVDLGPTHEFLHQGRISDALRLLGDLAAESLETNPDAGLLHAVLLVNNGRVREAEKACERLLRLDDLNPGIRYVLALCREQAGDLPGAVEQDRVAAYLDPEFAMPHLHLGLLARRSNEMATARREFGAARTLLAREDASRILLFGGGFTREALAQLCRSACGEAP